MGSFSSGFLNMTQALNMETEERLKSQKLALEERDLAFRQSQDRQKLKGDALKQLMDLAPTIVDHYVNGIGTNYQEGTPAAKGLDAFTQELARALSLNDKDPEIASAWRQGVVAQMTKPKLMQGQPGTQLLEVDSNNNVTSRYIVPPTPSELQRSAEYAAGGDTNKARQYVADALGSRNQERFSGQTPVFDAAGKQVAWVRSSDKNVAPQYIDINTGQPVQPKPDWSANTLSSQQQGSLSGKQVIDLARETLEEGQSIDAMVKMVTEAQSADQGYKMVAEKFTGAIKTFLGNKKNEQEFRAAIQSGNLAGALGGLRVPILGPGVMTQQDKEFLVSAVGGDVNALRDPEVMAYHVGNLIQRKLQMYSLNREQLATQAGRFPKLGIKVPDEKKVDMSIFERKAAPAADETYKDAASVTAAYQSKKITREQAAKILRDNGWAQ